MPYHNPIPDKKQPSGPSGMLGAWVQAEKFIQIALVPPCAAFIGWLPGEWLDRRLHTSWVAMAGIVFGILAGLVAAVRMAMAFSSDPKLDHSGKNGNERGDPETKSNSGKTS